MGGATPGRTIAIPVTMDLLVEERIRATLESQRRSALGDRRHGLDHGCKSRNAGELQFFTAFLDGERRQLRAARRHTKGGTGAVDVPYGKVSGSADKGWDFDGSNGTLHWANGETSPKSIRLSIYGDGEAQRDLQRSAARSPWAAPRSAARRRSPLRSSTCLRARCRARLPAQSSRRAERCRDGDGRRRKPRAARRPVAQPRDARGARRAAQWRSSAKPRPSSRGRRS